MDRYGRRMKSLPLASLSKRQHGRREKFSIFLIFLPFAVLHPAHPVTRHYFNVSIISLDYIRNILSRKCFFLPNVSSETPRFHIYLRCEGGRLRTVTSFIFVAMWRRERRRTFQSKHDDDDIGTRLKLSSGITKCFHEKSEGKR